MPWCQGGEVPPEAPATAPRTDLAPRPPRTVPCTTAPDIARNWRRLISICVAGLVADEPAPGKITPPPGARRRAGQMESSYARRGISLGDPPPMDRSLIDSLPPPHDAGDFAEVRRLVGASRRKAVVLDDDPTGTQTVHGLDVLADWSVDALAAALSDPRTCFFILTNTRSLPAAQAAALVGAISANLSAA